MHPQAWNAPPPGQKGSARRPSPGGAGTRCGNLSSNVPACLRLPGLHAPPRVYPASSGMHQGLQTTGSFWLVSSDEQDNVSGNRGRGPCLLGCVCAPEGKRSLRRAHDGDQQRCGLGVLEGGTDLRYFPRMKDCFVDTILVCVGGGGGGDSDVLFPSAAVSNYYEPSGLELHTSILYGSGGQRSRTGLAGLEPRCQAGCDPSWRLCGTIFFSPSPPSGGFPRSSARGLFPSSRSRGIAPTSFCACVVFPSPCPVSLPTSEDPGDDIGPSQMIQNNLPISKAAD